jgi:hypothetical protein
MIDFVEQLSSSISLVVRQAFLGGGAPNKIDIVISMHLAGHRSEDICEAAGISRQYLHVILSRARKSGHIPR